MVLLHQRLLSQACSGGSHWLRAVTSAVTDSHDPVLQRSLVWARSLKGCSLVPAPLEVAASGLLQLRSLTRVCFGGGCRLRPATTVVADLCPVPPRSLAQACSLSGVMPFLKANIRFRRYGLNT